MQVLLGQLLIGLINGAFYAMLSLGLAVIFGLMRVANVAHGALFSAGAFVALVMLEGLGLGYWWALIVAPLVVGILGAAIERTLLRRIRHLDHLYGFLLTYGIALVIEALLRDQLGSSGRPYMVPALLTGGHNLGFMFLPNYRAFVVIAAALVSLCTWLVIEKTPLGARLRAATENPPLVQAFGINVPLLVTMTYAGGVALAALAGVIAAPIYQVSPTMGSDLIIVVFAVVVIGGMGSIGGSIITGFALGLIEGLTKYLYPQAANTVIFVIMAVVLLVKPAGLFGSPIESQGGQLVAGAGRRRRGFLVPFLATAAVFALAPLALYPTFLMKVMCFAIFASAFNLLLGYAGMFSFGHAMFFGTAGYVAAYAAKAWTWPPEIAILAGTVAAALLGLVVGALSIKRQGIYFAMVTLAFAQMLAFYAVEAPFTHGEDGIQSVPRGLLFGLIDLHQPAVMYTTVLAIFLAAMALCHRVVHSPFGQVLEAIRENEQRAISLGYDAYRYKLVAFVLSAALAGLAGALKDIVFQLATLSDVQWTASGDVVLMTLLGGVGTLLGPLVGAALMVGLEEFFANRVGVSITLIQGLVLIICVLIFRRGIVGELRRLLPRSLKPT